MAGNPLIEVLKALNAHKARYVVVGGFAVVMHGVVRLTQDLDIVIDLRTAEALKAMQALASIGFVPKVPVKAVEFAQESNRRDWIENRNMIEFSLIDPNRPFFCVDVFATEPFPFEDMLNFATKKHYFGLEFTIASIPQLVMMKRVAGRPKDLQDIDELEFVQEFGPR